MTAALLKRFYVEWLDEDGDLETTPFWATGPADAVAQADDWLLSSAARVLGVHGDWDAVIVGCQVMTRADWEGREAALRRIRETAPTAAAMAEFFGSLLGGGRTRHDELPR